MSKPVIADIKPHKTELKPGETYYFCRCGRSANQPFCDGSHAGTDITPLGFEADKDEGYLCMCKHSANFPIAMAPTPASTRIRWATKAPVPTPFPATPFPATACPSPRPPRRNPTWN